ncbi:MAG: TonB-dependent receptor [Chitinophagales bacterium]|nr:TonB-dependent receptor [Chitinophagales bacterium]
MKHLLILLIGVLTAGGLFAQSRVQSIRGSLVDKVSKIPLPGASIILVDSLHPKYAVSDAEGNFRIDSVAVGRQTIKVSFIGYDEMVIPNILVGSAKEIVLSLELTETVTNLKEVVVSGKRTKQEAINDYSVVSTTTLSTEQTTRFAGSFEDPSRALMSFAGVSNGSGSDIEQEIVIRGNSPRGLMWRMEGVEVPSPCHYNYEGASNGAVCAIGSFVLDASDFSTGAFAAEYGNATSGVFDVRLRKGNNQKHELTAEASLLGLSLGVEGPLSRNKKASYLVNYRYSTLGVLDKMGIRLVGNNSPSFQDLTYKLNIPTKKAGTFSLFGLAGMSTIKFFDERTLFDTLKYQEDEFQGSDVFIAGLSNNYIFNERTWLTTVGAFTATRTHVDEGFAFTGTERIQTEKAKLWNYTGRGSVTLNNKFNARHDLKSGFILSYLSYNYFFADFNYNTYTVETKFDDAGGTFFLQAFTNWRWRIGPRWTWNTGIHAMMFVLNNNLSIEPRSSLKFQIDEKQYLSFGFGIHSRREALSTYLAFRENKNGERYRPNENLDFTKAAHFVLGYDRTLGKDVHLKAEVYYQHLYQVPIRPGASSDYSALNESNVISTRQLVNEGFGRNYGLELTLEKFFSKGYFFLINSSIYNSLFTPGDGLERNTRYNGNFIVNALAGKEYKVGKEKNNIFGFGGKATAAGGQRYTPIDIAASIGKNDYVYRKEDLYSLKTPVFYRFDLYVNYKLNRKRCSVTWRFDIQNFTNRANVITVEYSFDGSVYEVKQGQILPVVGCKVEF